MSADWPLANVAYPSRDTTWEEWEAMPDRNER